MFTGHYRDISELSYQLTKKLVYAGPDVIDYITSADTQLHDILVRADSAVYPDFDMKKVWLTSSRWSSLVRQYLDPVTLEAWLEMIETKLNGRKRGLSFMRTEVVNKSVNTTNGRERRRWGSCLLGVGYRAMPHPTLALHSRTTYLGYIGQLDLALAAVIAKQVAERVGLEPEEISFTWHLEAAQFHGFKSLAWFFQRERDAANLEKVEAGPALRAKYPTLFLCRKQLEYIYRCDDEGILYGDMSFAQQTRIRRRYHTEVIGPEYGKQFNGGTKRPTSMINAAAVLPSIPIDKLDLSPLRTRYSNDLADKAGFIDDEEESE